MLSTWILWMGIALAGDWENLGVTNDVTVYRKQTSGTDLFAFKGEATSDLSVAQLMAVLRNESIASEWVNMMMFGKVVEQYSENHLLIHQGYDLPWPVSDRDYVFDKNGKTKIVVEVLTDPEGALPDWAVNSIQADWPHKSITSLIIRASKGDLTPDPKAKDWQ